MASIPFDMPGGCGLFDAIPPGLRSGIYDELPNEVWVRHPDVFFHGSGEQEVGSRRGPTYFGSGSELISMSKALGREVVRTRGEHFKNLMVKLTIDVSSTRADGGSAVENIASTSTESAERERGATLEMELYVVARMALSIQGSGSVFLNSQICRSTESSLFSATRRRWIHNTF